MLAALVLPLVGLRAVLPRFAERKLEEVVSGALVARFELGDVDFALYEGEVVLEDLTLRAADTGAELAAVRRIALDLDWGALLFGSLEAESLKVEAPQLFFAFDPEGRFNWAGLGATSEAEPEPEPAPEPSFRVKIARVEPYVSRSP